MGTWRLVSFVSRDGEGRENDTYGAKGVGLLMYDGGGHMSVQIARAEHEPGRSDDYFGYFGSYTIDEGATTVTHHVIAGSDPSFSGTDQRRDFHWRGDRLVLSTPSEQTDDSIVTYVAT